MQQVQQSERTELCSVHQVISFIVAWSVINAIVVSVQLFGSLSMIQKFYIYQDNNACIF